MAIRLDGPRAWGLHLRIDWVVTDPDESHALTVRNGVLSHTPGRHDEAEAALVVERAALDQLLLRAVELGDLVAAGRLQVEGDPAKLGELLGLLEEPDPVFRDRDPGIVL